MLVTIKCCQKIHYNQDIEMDEEDFETLKEVSGEDIDNLQNEYELIERVIDTNDVFDVEQEFTDFEIYEAKPNQ